MSSRVIGREELGQVRPWVFGRLAPAGVAPAPRADDGRAAVEEAVRAGYAEGRAKAEREVRAAAAVSLQRLAGAADAADAAVQELVGEMAGSLVDLAFSIARQVLCAELKTRPEAVLAVIREAIGELPISARHVQLLLHPGDAAVVRDTMEGELKRIDGQIVEDAAITPGGCRLRLQGGETDASIETRWRAVADALGRNHELRID
jgi:flagellar assembly protein FliH